MTSHPSPPSPPLALLTPLPRLMTVDGVLTEPCDEDRSCNLDASMFKGIFCRNLRYLLDLTTNATRAAHYRTFLANNVRAVQRRASCSPGHGHHCHIVYLDGAPAFPATGNTTPHSSTLP